MVMHRPMLLLVLVLVLIASSHFSMVATSSKYKNKVPKPRKTKPKFPEPNNPYSAFQHFSVEIHNDLHMFILDSHCTSKDDDLGLHILFPDEEQNWSFHDNWLDSTDFHCKLEWQYGLLEFEAFYSNHGKFLVDHCANSTCIWSARQDGVYLNNKDDELVLYDYWDMLG